MKKSIIILVFALVQHFVFGQKNFIDQPYLETSASVDTLVTPDRIYLSININEADSKNKKSLEEQERAMEAAFKRLGINTEKDLVLTDLMSNFKNYFLRGQNVLKSKRYELLVRNAVTAGKVLMELENIGISNTYISRTEYSKKEELLLGLRGKAIAKSKIIAESMLKPLQQKLGKAIFISDTHLNSFGGRAEGVVMRAYSAKSLEVSPEPIDIEIKKIKFETSVSVKYILD